MGRKQAQKVIENIEASGFQAYFVGGCVRDTLLGREPGDWDIASSAHPEQIMDIFGTDAIPTGCKHGTVTVKSGGETFEVTTFRTDGQYTDGRHPDRVTFADTIEDDLARRDFTINAMAIDKDGHIIDLYNGAGDLKRGIIRCVGDAGTRFEEDALRILRALRFASTLNFTMEPATAEAIHREAGLLKKIAAERILTEMNKLLCGEGCREILLAYPDVLGVFLPELLPCVGFDQRNIHHCYDLYTHTVAAVDSVERSPVLRWTMLLHDIGKVDTFTVDVQGQGHFYGHPDRSAQMAEEICTRLRMKKRDREDIVTLIAWHDRNIPVTKKGIGSAVRALGEENFRRLLAVKRADNLAQAPEYRWVGEKIHQAEVMLDALLQEKSCLHLKDLSVKGNDLLALGYKGREVGEALEWLLEGVIAGEIVNDRASLLAALQKKS